jgi:hypothetical protein
LERRLCDAFDRGEFGALADAPRRLKTEPSAVMLPWLASEWGLGELARFFPDLPSLIDAALPWLMERGTAAAVERALSWIGFDDVLIEEHGARLSLDLGRIPTTEELEDVVHLIVLSIPAHVTLYRLYHGHDLRPIGVSRPEPMDAGLLSDDSGVWITIDGKAVKLSFGISREVHVVSGLDHRVHGHRHDTTWTRTFYEDRPRLDVSFHGDVVTVPNRKIIVISGIWFQSEGIDANPPTLGRRLDIARSATDLDNDIDPLGDLNCGFAGGYDIELNPFVLDESLLSDHDNQLVHVFIDEKFHDERRSAADLAPRAEIPGWRRHDTTWTRTFYEDYPRLDVSLFGETRVIPNRRIMTTDMFGAWIRDVLPLDVAVPTERVDAHSLGVAIAPRSENPAARVDARALALAFWPATRWAGGWDGRRWGAIIHESPSREDIFARHDTLALADVTVASDAGETRVLTLAVEPETSYPGTRHDIGRGISHLYGAATRWAGGWDGRRWRQTLDIPSNIIHITQEQ